MRLCKGATEGPRRVRQLDRAFLFGHEWIVAHPSITRIWWVVTGPWLLVRLAFECEVLGK